ncbi:hypothetical protein HK102_006883 [Quaeritorhiza haematococci]|nr:hypothetical protein HK102_006883 [Quaeritorhiza haematococci]
MKRLLRSNQHLRKLEISIPSIDRHQTPKNLATGGQEPSEPAVVWTNLVSLTLMHLPCFRGRMLELLAMAINTKAEYRVPLQKLTIVECPLVGSDELQALLRVSHDLRGLGLVDVLAGETSSPAQKILINNAVLDVIADFCPHLQSIAFKNCRHVSQKASVVNVITSCSALTFLMFWGQLNPALCEFMKGGSPDIVVEGSRLVVMSKHEIWTATESDEMPEMDEFDLDYGE